MGKGSITESCYRIDGFKIIIDPFGDPSNCLTIQDKVIIGLLIAAFIFSIPFVHFILGLLYPIFWCLGLILPQMNSREDIVAQSKQRWQDVKF